MRFYPQRMLQNFAHSDGMITAERLMLELGRRGLGRDRAHHLVHELCIEHSKRLHAFHESVREHLVISDTGVGGKLPRNAKGSIYSPDMHANPGGPNFQRPAGGVQSVYSKGKSTASGPPSSALGPPASAAPGSPVVEPMRLGPSAPPRAARVARMLDLERASTQPCQPSDGQRYSSEDAASVRASLDSPLSRARRAKKQAQGECACPGVVGSHFFGPFLLLRRAGGGAGRLTRHGDVKNAGGDSRRRRRLSLSSIEEKDLGGAPAHPGSLGALAAHEPEVIEFLGDGDSAKAAAVAEALLDPNNYTGECSRLAKKAALRAKHGCAALTDLSQRYTDISERVMHGRADRATVRRPWRRALWRPWFD
jgi:hypothetical protein